MMYAGALTTTMQNWRMTSSEAGLVQAAFNFCFALSLVVFSLLADRFGAKRVFRWANTLTAIASVACALFARSMESGLVLFAALGLAQGGTYGPSIMLVAQGVPLGRRGTAVGWLLAAASFGYFGSIALSNSISRTWDYETAFLICGGVSAAGAIAAIIGVRDRPNLKSDHALSWMQGCQLLRDRASALLTLGYMAHCWELLGMWAWMPAFLTAALSFSTSLGQFSQGLWVAAAIHLSGGIATFSMGYASDKFGSRRVLILIGMMGAICSISIGWMINQPPAVILLLAAVYGFAVIGDSPVLSAAMTKAVEPGRLGMALAVRSILGFGVGGMAPLAFGFVRDGQSDAAVWGWPFTMLGIGGVLATYFAVLLPRDRPRNKLTGSKRGFD